MVALVSEETQGAADGQYEACRAFCILQPNTQIRTLCSLRSR